MNSQNNPGLLANFGKIVESNDHIVRENEILTSIYYKETSTTSKTNAS